MKMFHTIRELINYCEHCKMCGGTRILRIDVGPDLFYGLEDFSMVGDILTLKCSYDANFDSAMDGNRIPIYVDINCKNNTFSVRNAITLYDEFFVSLYGVCPSCDSFVNSSDIDTTSDSQSFFNIGVDSESFFLDNTDLKFNVMYYYYDVIQTTMTVSKLLVINEENGNWSAEKAIDLPFMDLNFSDEKATVEMLNMLITFS